MEEARRKGEEEDKALQKVPQLFSKVSERHRKILSGEVM